MFADALTFTHNGTGGSSTITLAAVSGSPQPSDVPGWVGTIDVSYNIAEYTDNTYATLKNYERGEGTLVVSTGVLTRAFVGFTWTSSVIALGSGSGTGAGATAVSFGNTAANIRITLADSMYTQSPALPAINTSNDGYAKLNSLHLLDSSSANSALVAGTKYYCPVKFAYGRPISKIGIQYNLGTTGNVRLSLYGWGRDGWPDNLLTEFTASSQIACNTASGIKTVTPATPYPVSPGWYWAMIQADAAISILQARAYGECGAGSASSRSIVFATKTGTYGAAPNPADTGLTTVSESSGDQWVISVQ